MLSDLLEMLVFLFADLGFLGRESGRVDWNSRFVDAGNFEFRRMS